MNILIKHDKIMVCFYVCWAIPGMTRVNIRPRRWKHISCVIRLVIDQKKDQSMFPNIHQRQPFNHISLSSSSNNNNNKKKDDNKNSQQSLCVLIPQALYLWIKPRCRIWVMFLGDPWVKPWPWQQKLVIMSCLRLSSKTSHNQEIVFGNPFYLFRLVVNIL